MFSVCDTVWYRPVSGTLPNIAYAAPIVTVRHTHVKVLSCWGLGQALHSLGSLFGTQAAWVTSLRPPTAPVLMVILVLTLLSYSQSFKLPIGELLVCSSFQSLAKARNIEAGMLRSLLAFSYTRAFSRNIVPTVVPTHKSSVSPSLPQHRPKLYLLLAPPYAVLASFMST